MYVVISNVYLNDVMHLPGEQIELTPELAEHLGAAVLEIKQPAPDKQKSKQ